MRSISELLELRLATTRQITEALGLDPLSPDRLRVLRTLKRLEGVKPVQVGRCLLWPTADLRGWLEGALAAEERESERKAREERRLAREARKAAGQLAGGPRKKRAPRKPRARRSRS